MRFIKYILITCIFFVACKNETAAPHNEEIKSSVPTKAVNTPDQKQEEVIPPKPTTIDTVTVKTLDDLIANAKSNTVLFLEKGTYRLKEDMVYMMSKNERRIIDKNKEDTRSIGGQLHISGLDNFQLIGKKGVVIESENIKAVPLFILGCNESKFSNLTITKKVKGTADLCYVSNSRDIIIEKCDFSGGGAYGIYANKVDNMNVNNCQIKKSTSGAIKINESKGVNFTNSTFSNNTCTLPMVLIYGSGSTLVLNNVNIVDNNRNPEASFQGSEYLFSVGQNSVKLNNCVVRNNTGFISLGLNQNSLSKTLIEGLKM